MRLLAALVLAAAGAWLGTRLAYTRYDPLYRGAPATGTLQVRAPDNAWKWWAGLLAGGVIGAALPFLLNDRH